MGAHGPTAERSGERPGEPEKPVRPKRPGTLKPGNPLGPEGNSRADNIRRAAHTSNMVTELYWNTRQAPTRRRSGIRQETELKQANNLNTRLMEAMADAEANAWDALAKGRFTDFAKYATTWQELEKVTRTGTPNPMRAAIRLGRTAVLGKKFVNAYVCYECGHQMDSATCRACGTSQTQVREPNARTGVRGEDCSYCNSKSSVFDGAVNVISPNGANPFMVTDVPAKVCDNCSDHSVSQETLEKLQAIAGGHSQPTGTITMDRYELS